MRAAAAEAVEPRGRRRAPGKRERALWDMARSLSENGRDPAGYALYQITFGVCQYLRGQWKASRPSSSTMPARGSQAVRRWQANANVFAVYALTYRGDLREVKLAHDAAARRRRAARRPLYDGQPAREPPDAAWLGADDVETARRHIRESMAQWSKTRFLVQHWQCACCWRPRSTSTPASGARAWDRLARDAQAMKRSHCSSVQLMRIAHALRAGAGALASLEALAGAERGRRLAQAIREHSAREGGDALDGPLASLLAASIAKATGDVPGAERALRRAFELGRCGEMAAPRAGRAPPARVAARRRGGRCDACSRQPRR